MRRAISTPTPSLGKNVSGANSRHFPSAIQVVSNCLSTSVKSSAIDVIGVHLIRSKPFEMRYHAPLPQKCARAYLYYVDTRPDGSHNFGQPAQNVRDDHSSCLALAGETHLRG
jgi:hypothetical protein